MNIHDIRIQNLTMVLTGLFKGNKSALASAINRQPSYIHRCLTQGEHHKPIGEKFARHIESSLGFLPGALDTTYGNDTPERRSLLTPLAAPILEPGPDLTLPFRRTPIVGIAQLGPDGYWDATTPTDGWLDIPSNDPDAYCLRVKGDSMAPAIRSGWVVWCEPNHSLIPGEYVMVRRINGESMVKELLYENNEEVSLMAVNDGYGRLTISRDDIEQIHYVGGLVPPSRIKY